MVRLPVTGISRSADNRVITNHHNSKRLRRDKGVTMTIRSIPFGVPITLESALQTLGDRDWVKIAHNTWFIKRQSGEVSVKLHLNEIIRIHPDGTYTLWARGFDTDATCRHLSDLAPVKVLPQQNAIMFRPIADLEGLHREFYDGIRIDRRGFPVLETNNVA